MSNQPPTPKRQIDGAPVSVRAIQCQAIFRSGSRKRFAASGCERHSSPSRNRKPTMTHDGPQICLRCSSFVRRWTAHSTEAENMSHRIKHRRRFMLSAKERHIRVSSPCLSVDICHRAGTRRGWRHRTAPISHSEGDRQNNLYFSRLQWSSLLDYRRCEKRSPPEKQKQKAQ